MARLAMATGGSPGTIGSVATPACWPWTFSCSCAAGRRTSSEAMRTFFFSRSCRRRAILAQLVVLPEPCRPTSMMPTGRSEEHTSELQSLMRISYAVFCLKKKKNTKHINEVVHHRHVHERYICEIH